MTDAPTIDPQDTSAPGPTIQELFSRDPMSLSDRDIDAIIAELRAKRASYIAGDKTAGNVKKSSGAGKAKAAAAASKPTKALDLQLDLGDLGL